MDYQRQRRAAGLHARSGEGGGLRGAARGRSARRGGERPWLRQGQVGPGPADNPTGDITDPKSEKNQKAEDKDKAKFADDLFGELQDGLRKADEDRADARQQAIQDQDDLNKSVAETVAQNEFDLSLVGKSNTQKAVAVALRQAEADAAAKGLTLTDAQRASVEATTRALSEAEDAEKARTAAARAAPGRARTRTSGPSGRRR